VQWTPATTATGSSPTPTATISSSPSAAEVTLAPIFQDMPTRPSSPKTKYVSVSCIIVDGYWLLLNIVFSVSVQWHAPCRTLRSMPLPTSSLSLVVTSHLVLQVFARQLLLSRIVFPLTFILAKLSQHSADI